MKIVIELSDSVFKRVRDDYVNPYEVDEMCAAILDGTILPEHHGRLIDEQQIIDRFKPVEKFEYWRIGLDGLVNVLSDAPTIIEGSDSK